MKPAIRIENLSKSFRIGARQDGYRTLRESLTEAAAAPFRRLHGAARRAFNPDYQGDAGDGRNGETLWALKDVSFDVQPGEVVGIIGRNGAGKSTLLKILSRITEPTAGRIALHGRVGSLLEVGTGFHPELTGRENIYMNGAILGMSRREIDRKFDEIVDFSGVEKFLDTPIKRYSSGMQVRLAFAVAANLQPEILIVDEVLAVGDAEFQKKCLGKMQDVAESGRTVLFVSHNMAAVESLCYRGLCLATGRMVFDGRANDAVTEYLHSNRSPTSDAGSVSLVDHPNRRRGCRSVLRAITVRDSLGIPTSELSCVESVTFEVEFDVQEPTQGLCIGLFVCHRGTRILMLHSNVHSRLDMSVVRCGVALCSVESLPLIPGTYNLEVALGNSSEVIDYVENATELTIVAGDRFGTGLLPNASQSLVLHNCTWECEQSVAS